MIVELRQYTLKPGRRDELIALFEREFVETQEAEGIDLIGTFRDAGDPDRFVWLRGLANMQSRARSLAAFYGGPVWKAHRSAANDTMIDSDNVLLLKPAWDGAAFAQGRREVEAREAVFAHICYFAAPVSEAFVAAFRASGIQVLAAFVTEDRANTFPALPVRAGEHVFVWFARDGAAALSAELAEQLVKPAETLRLVPTARSRLR